MWAVDFQFDSTTDGRPINIVSIIDEHTDDRSFERALSQVAYTGFVIVDDYQIPACAKAVHDFRERYGITSPILRIDRWGTYWRVDHAPIR